MNLEIQKTIKLFIGGKFPRTESGRVFPVKVHGSDKIYANMCQASRKDLRNSVEIAKGALSRWSSKTAYNRSQILYRMAEMAESKRAEFTDVLKTTLGYSEEEAISAVNDMIHAFVYYGGFADKYQQVIGAVNPVAGPHHNFSTPEPVGVVGLVSAEEFDLGALADQIASIVCSGNTLVVLLEEKASAILAPLSEVIATSDVPGGVINLLSGFAEELLPHFISHMEIQSLSFQRKSQEELTAVQQGAIENMKRVIPYSEKKFCLENILNFVEIKTVWHPVGH